MKKISLIITILLLFITTGCGKNNILKDSYNKMQISKDGIDGYVLNLRIYGTANKKKANEILTITNYKNELIKVEKLSNQLDKSTSTNHSINDKFNINTNKEFSYVKNGKYYISDEKGSYKESSDIDYKNPSIYLKGLINFNSIDKGKKVTVGDNKYTLYKVVYKKSIVEKMLKDTIIEKMNIEKDVNGEIYIDKDGYVYRIIYEIDNLTINANYYNINNVNPFSVPISQNNENTKV